MGTGSEPSVEKTLDLSFYSVLYLAQALAYQDISKADMGLVSNRMQQVASEVVYNPARAVLLGPGRAIPKEIPGITCRNIDIDLESDLPEACADRLVSELVSARESATLALRRGERFIETFDPLLIDGGSQDAQLEKGGVYLITEDWVDWAW